MVIGIIARADDVVIYAILLQPFVVVGHQRRVLHLFGMDDDLSLRTHLATSLAGVLQGGGEKLPVRILIAAPVALGLQLTVAVVHHSPGDLVTRLDEVGCSPSGDELFKTVLGVGIDIGGRRGVHRLKQIGCGLLAGVGPRVGIVEVEHEFQPGILDPLA